jgi:hypothetical protein
MLKCSLDLEGITVSISSCRNIKIEDVDTKSIMKNLYLLIMKMETFALKYRQPIRGFKTQKGTSFLPDYKLKSLRETLQRQTYSPKHNSFQMDIIDVISEDNKSKKNQ